MTKGEDLSKVVNGEIGVMGYQLMLAHQPSLDGIGKAKRTRRGCTSEEADSYQIWIRNHPSALKMFDEMMSRAKNKRVVVFLDYDGTLSPIVDDPDQAFMSEPMRLAVRDVANCFPTAIISGRSRDKVYDFVRLENVFYAGSHGMDIAVVNLPSVEGDGQCKSKVVGQEVVLCQPAKEYFPEIQKIYAELAEKTKTTKGAVVENNRFCLSVHFRRVDEKDWSILESQVVTLLTKYPNFRLTRGRKVMEIRPIIKWDKGNALEYILDALGFGASNDVLPVYIGDDRTDEDAFKVLRKRKMGYPIIVSSIPKNTRASYSLRDPSEVRMFLTRLAKCGRSDMFSQ